MYPLLRLIVQEFVVLKYSFLEAMPRTLKCRTHFLKSWQFLTCLSRPTCQTVTFIQLYYLSVDSLLVSIFNV